MTRRFFSGSTLDQAVMMAARHYELDPEELAYRQIEKRHGFLRTRKAVMIAVDPEDPRRQPATAAAGGEPPAADAAEEERSATRAPDRPAANLEIDAPTTETRPAEVAESLAEPPDPAWQEAAVEPQPQAPEQEATVEPRPPAPQQEPVSSPARQAPARTVAHDSELLEAAEEASRRLMSFAGVDAGASARSAGERIEVEVVGPDASLLVVEEGNGLLAIQHLLPRMLRGMTGRSSFVRVDSQGFHQQRRERLEALALKEAEAASRTGTPRTLPPMAPDERRIVHLALQDAPTVTTESRGTGLHKRVVVRPVTGDGGVDDIEARHGF